MKRVLWFKGSKGLDNRRDPMEGEFNAEVGVADAKICYNIDFGKNGRISRRKGWQYTDVSSSCHSLFCDGGETLFVTGDALSILGSDYTYTPIRNVTTGAKMNYVQVGSRIYYTNGSEMGYVLAGASMEWSGPNTHGVKDSTKVLTGPPVGTKLAYFNGRMYVVQGYIAWFSKAYDVNTFDMAGSYLAFESEITMFHPVKGGIWVGTRKRIAFIRGNGPESFVFERKGLAGVIPGTDVELDAGDIGDGRLQEVGILFVGTDGIYFGSADGQLIPMVKRRLDLPSVSNGASICDRDKFITSLGMRDDSSKLTLSARLDNTVFGQYLNYNFNSFCHHGDDKIGANSNGIFKLDVTDRDVSAVGTATAIAAKYESFLSDLGLRTDKQLRRCRVALEAAGELKFTFETNEVKIVSQTKVPDYRENEEHVLDVSVGRDLKGRFFSFIIENVKGADFSADEIEAHVHVLLRKPS